MKTSDTPVDKPYAGCEAVEMGLECIIQFYSIQHPHVAFCADGRIQIWTHEWTSRLPVKGDVPKLPFIEVAEQLERRTGCTALKGTCRKNGWPLSEWCHLCVMAIAAQYLRSIPFGCACRWELPNPFNPRCPVHNTDPMADHAEEVDAMVEMDRAAEHAAKIKAEAQPCCCGHPRGHHAPACRWCDCLAFLKPELTSAKTPSCSFPPIGWLCTRPTGHDGPCAAVPETCRCGHARRNHRGEEGTDTPRACAHAGCPCVEYRHLAQPAEFGLNLHMLRHNVIEAAKARYYACSLAGAHAIPVAVKASSRLDVAVQNLIAGEDEHAKILAANPPVENPAPYNAPTTWAGDSAERYKPENPEQPPPRRWLCHCDQRNSANAQACVACRRKRGACEKELI